MEVCFLAPELLPIQGGVGSYSVEMVRELASRVDLTVLTLVRHKGKETKTQADMEAFFGHRARILTVSEASDTFVYNARFQIAVLRTIKRLSATNRFDVVHSQHAHMPDLLSGMIRRIPPTVRTIHTTIQGQREGIRVAESLGGALEASERWQVVLQPLLRSAEWLTLHRNDYHITVSEWMGRELVRQGVRKDRISVIYPGVDTVRYRPDAGVAGSLATRPGAPVVLFSGRPTIVKGVSILARAIPLILNRIPEAEFVFTGAGSEEFTRFIDPKSAARGHVRFLGFVSPETLPTVYASVDLAVVPTFYENLPFRILECLAAGVPVVATDVSGVSEAVVSGKTGLLIPPGSPGALADAVVTILEDRSLRARMSAAARASVLERFSWARAADATVRVYEQAAGGAS